MAAQPRACGAHRRHLHLFPVLRLPAVAGAPAGLSGAGPQIRQIQCRLRHVQAGCGGAARADLAAPARKATTLPAMPAAISTAPTGRAPTGIPNSGASGRSSRTPMRSTASTASRRAGGVSSAPRSGVSALPISRPARGSTRRLRMPAIPMMPAACRADRPGRELDGGRARFALPQIPHGPSGRRGDRHGLQHVRAQFRRASSARTRTRSSKTAPSMPSRRPSTPSTRASGRRCSSASISR